MTGSAENVAGLHPHRWCPSEFPNCEGRCPACGYRPERLTTKGMIRTHRTRVLPPAERDCNGYALGSSCECASSADCPASRVLPPEGGNA